jgi:hypothetical protein
VALLHVRGGKEALRDGSSVLATLNRTTVRAGTVVYGMTGDDWFDSMCESR